VTTPPSRRYDHKEGGVVSTVTKFVFDVELSPLEHDSGVANLHDIHLDENQILEVGTRVELRDEGGFFHAATVVAITPGEFGRNYELHIQP
jgi:hypothetical protein